MRTSRVFLSILISLSILFQGPTPAQGNPMPDISPVIEKYRVEIPKIMEQENIPGLAVAVVDGQSVLWAEGFGFTDSRRKIPVTADTIFSIQSMSKSFTATAAMFAVQEGLIDLNTPVAEYLPGFAMNSLFEEHPQEKINLFHLLSHTAGFPHEAPQGGNYTTAPSFDAHIKSIQQTWLRFPVGTRYSYSNLGIDLAGYILQERSNKPFTQYVQETIYDRMGMHNSSFAIPSLRKRADRAIGNSGAPFPPPTDFTILPSGGVYVSANDMARYLLFHINKGMLDGQRLLREDLIETMYNPPNLAARIAGYGLGVGVETINNRRRIGHGGGGFGFLSQMFWYPELKVGIVILTNSTTHNQQVSLPLSILDDVLAANSDVYTQRAKEASITKPAFSGSGETKVTTNMALEGLIREHTLMVDPGSDASQARKNSSTTKEHTQKIAGKWMLVTFGMPGPIIDIIDKNGQLFYQNQEWIEVQPNVYFSPLGERAVVHGRRATLQQIPAVKLDPAGKIILTIFYGLAALLCFAMLLVPLGLRVGRKPGWATAFNQLESHHILWISVPIVLIAIIGLFISATELAVPNLLYLPWPRGWAEMQAWVKILLALPYAASALVLVEIIATGIGLLRGQFLNPQWQQQTILLFLLWQVVFYLVVIF